MSVMVWEYQSDRHGEKPEFAYDCDKLRRYHDSMTDRFCDPDCSPARRKSIMKMYFDHLEDWREQYDTETIGGEEYDVRRRA